MPACTLPPYIWSFGGACMPACMLMLRLYIWSLGRDCMPACMTTLRLSSELSLTYSSGDGFEKRTRLITP